MFRFFLYCCSFILLVSVGFGQSTKFAKELNSLIEYRQQIMNSTCSNDSVKELRCKDKLAQYKIDKKKYLQKIDSMDRVVIELNKLGSKFYYYLNLGKPKYFDWGECNDKDMGNGRKLTHFTFHDGTSDYIDSDMFVEKIEKLKIDMSGLTSGKTFYLEDVK